MAPKSTKLDLSLSQQSQSSLDGYFERLSKIEKSYIQLVGLAKKLSDMNKALTAKGALDNLPAYNRGQQAGANRRTQQTIRDGQAVTGNLAEEKNRAKVAQDLVRSGRDQIRNADALALSLRKVNATTKTINDLAVLKKQLMDAEHRKGLELIGGDARRVASAQKMVDTTQNQIKALTGQKLSEAEMAKARAQADREALKSARELIELNRKAEQARKNAIPNYNAGLDTRRTIRESGIASQGSAQGRALAVEGSLAARSNKINRDLQAELKNSQALEMSIGRIRLATKGATDQQALKNQLLLVERRIAFEIDRGNVGRTAAARRLQTVIQERIVALQREQTLLRESNRLAAQRAKEEAKAQRDEQARILRAARQDPRAVAERGRAATNERLFGDGGANLLKIQAGLSANYLLLNTARTLVADSLTFTKDLDASLRQLQAIVVITDAGLGKLRDTFFEVANNTKFSAVEVADAAVIMGQAGLSVGQIKEAISAVALLATASGTDLTGAVSLATSVMGVFNLEAGQMGHIANALTEAVNVSKLDIDKLALGLQYAGNTAAESGVRFEELTAALATMSNMGIRSGSTLGTGMRQILISLQKPSKEFRATLDRLGLTMTDVDVRTHGLYGVMKNLSDAGFTAGDAIKSFEIRGAAAFTALAKGLPQMLAVETALYDTNAAAKANETQMRSLANQMKRSGDSFKAVVASGLEPMVFAIRDVFKGLGDFLGRVDQTGNGLRALSVTIAALALGGLVKWTAGLVVGFGAMFLGATSLSSGLQVLAVSSTIAGGALGRLGMFTAVLVPWAPLILGIAAAAGIGALAWGSYNREVALGTSAIGTANTKLEESTGAAEAYAAQISMTSDKLREINSRSGTLATDNKLLEATVKSVKNQFSEMGLDVDSVTGTVENLIGVLTRLRTDLSEKYVIQLEVQAQDLLALDTLEKGRKASALRSASSKLSTSVFVNDQDQMVSGGEYVGVTPGDLKDPDTLRLSGIQRQLVTQIGELNQVKGGPSSQQKKAIIYAESVLADVNAALESSRTIDALQASLGKNEDDRKTVQSALTPQYQVADAEIQRIEKRITDGVQEIQTNRRGDAVGADNSIQALVRSAERDILAVEEQLDELVALGVIGETAKEALTKLVGGTRLKMNEASSAADENSLPMREAQVSEKVKVLEEARAELDVLLEKATSPRAIDAIVARIFELEAETNAALAEQLGLSDAESSSGEVQAKQAEAAAEARRRSLATSRQVVAARQALISKAAGGIKDSATSFVSTYGEKFVESRGMLAELQKEVELRALVKKYGEDSAQVENRRLAIAREIYVEQLKGQPFAKQQLATWDTLNKPRNIGQERVQASQAQYQRTRQQGAEAEVEAKKLLKVQEDQLRMQQLINMFGEGSLVVQKARAEEERKVYEALVLSLGVSDSMEASLMAAYDRTAEATSATYGWAQAMAEVATQIQGIMSALSSLGAGAMGNVARSIEITALKAGKTAATAKREAAQKQTDAEFYAREQGAKNPIQRAIIKAERSLYDYGLKQEDELEVLRANAPTAKVKKAGGGGGGGGGKDKKDEKFERFMANLEGNLGAAASGPAGAIQTQRGQQLVDAAKAEAERRAKQIEFLQGQTLTAAKQKELNKLVGEHTQLLDFVADAEEKILGIKNKQGLTQEALGKSIREWMASNLNMSQVLESGTVGVLDNMKSSFSTLFTDLTSGAMTGKEAFRNFAASVIKSMQSVVAEMLAVYAMKKLLGWVGGMFGGGAGGDFFGGLLSSLTGAKSGGPVGKGMNSGGQVDSPSAMMGSVKGNFARDSVPRMLMPDEFVLRASAVSMIGVDRLNAINNAGNRRMASGGMVSGIARAGQGGIKEAMNIWMAPPDQRPIPGPNDMIAVISNDMAQGGATKRLIKSIIREG